LRRKYRLLCSPPLLTIEPESLTAEQIDRLIGEEGTVIDALQYLANTILNLGQTSEGQMAYTIEINGYRVRRYVQLKAMAESAAQQVRETGQEVEMQLSAAERRLVHTVFQGPAFEDLETYSRGQEPDRRLVVKPKTLEVTESSLSAER
jgi:spoIIIJ-associated protein